MRVLAVLGGGERELVVVVWEESVWEKAGLEWRRLGQGAGLGGGDWAKTEMELVGGEWGHTTDWVLELHHPPLQPATGDGASLAVVTPTPQHTHQHHNPQHCTTIPPPQQGTSTHDHPVNGGKSDNRRLHGKPRTARGGR